MLVAETNTYYSQYLDTYGNESKYL